ncbi:MAG: phosphatidylglycerol lysyltransferase domain-containing protein [Treponema sp.]|jgi:hypothetical protein|nr:phosphatidylglycerol lysyltransferase domain-containing protein [Treponema sp.]
MQDQKAYHFFQDHGFLPLGKSSYPLFKEYEPYSELQEMSAVMLTAWSAASRGLYTIILGHLCGVYFYEHKPVSFTIHRKPEPREYSLQKVIDILYGLSQEAELPFLCVKFIDEGYVPEFQALEGYDISPEFSRDNCEYVYKNADFLDLTGKINAMKRRRLNTCFKDPSITFQPITNKTIGLCLSIQEAWCEKKDCLQCASYCGCEKEALNIMIDIFDENIHKGLFLRVDHIPRGYIISEPVSKKRSCLYFGKGLNHNHYLYGLYMTAQSDNADYFNFNEDMGSEGLRQFKTHLGRYSLLNKYICRFKKKEKPDP